MRRFFGAVVIAAGCLVLIGAGTTAAQEAASHKYIGVAKCKMCHINPNRTWAETKHAKAFESLKTDEAKKYSPNPTTDPTCLKCHVTGYEQPGGYVIPTAGDAVPSGDAGAVPEALAKSMEGVQCESCHGPGEKYKDIKVMKDRALSLQNGLIMPTEEVCLKCHNNKEAPTFVEGKWDFKARVEEIKHTK